MSLVSPVKFRQRLADKLRNVSYRRRFFRLRAQEEIAQQIKMLRGMRRLRQVDFAKRAKMKQSAVSRIEQASYSAWTFKTLLRVGEALDAQVRVIFEAAEDVIERYARGETKEQGVSKPGDWQTTTGVVDTNPFVGSYGSIPSPIPSFFNPVILGDQEKGQGTLATLKQRQAMVSFVSEGSETRERQVQFQ